MCRARQNRHSDAIIPHGQTYHPIIYHTSAGIAIASVKVFNVGWQKSAVGCIQPHIRHLPAIVSYNSHTTSALYSIVLTIIAPSHTIYSCALTLHRRCRYKKIRRVGSTADLIIMQLGSNNRHFLALEESGIGVNTRNTSGKHYQAASAAS